MDEFKSLKKRIADLEKLIAVERQGYNDWFKNYHKMFIDMWHVLERIAFMLNLECVKENNIRCCCKYNDNNPILQKLKSML